MIAYKMTSFPQIILASQSPARAEIMTQIRIPFALESEYTMPQKDPVRHIGFRRG